MVRSAAVQCKKMVEDLVTSFFARDDRPRVKVIQLHPTEEREDTWVVVIGIPLDAPFYAFDDEVNVGVILEPKRDDVKVVDDEPPMRPRIDRGFIGGFDSPGKMETGER